MRLWRPLMAADGRVVRWLELQYEVAIWAQVLRNDRSELWVFAGSGMLMFGLLSVALWAWVLKPLGMIDLSLARDDVRVLQPLLKAGVSIELARVARMIEASRFCVDTSIAGVRRGRILNDATLTLFAGVVDWSIRSGFDEIVLATDVRFERILKRAHWPMRRLGEMTLIGDTPSVAGLLPANRMSFETVRPPRYVFSRLAPLSSAA